MLKLKGNVLLQKAGVDNIHQFALRSQVSVATAYKYASGEVKAVDLAVLPTILIHGAGMTKEQILEMPIGELFEFVD